MQISRGRDELDFLEPGWAPSSYSRQAQELDDIAVRRPGKLRLNMPVQKTPLCFCQAALIGVWILISKSSHHP